MNSNGTISWLLLRDKKSEWWRCRWWIFDEQKNGKSAIVLDQIKREKICWENWFWISNRMNACGRSTLLRLSQRKNWKSMLIRCTFAVWSFNARWALPFNFDCPDRPAEDTKRKVRKMVRSKSWIYIPFAEMFTLISASIWVGNISRMDFYMCFSCSILMKPKQWSQPYGLWVAWAV